MLALKIDKSIFRAYDIRGIYNSTLNEETIYAIGQALGTKTLKAGQTSMVVARDGRLSGPMLIQALKEGILTTGCDVIDIGMVPTPVLYFATHVLTTNSGVMLTGSHNPADYNGLKIVIDGKTLYGQAIFDIYETIVMQNFYDGLGQCTKRNILNDYANAILNDVKLKKPLKVVVDCGNGVAGVIAPDLLRKLGCEVIELFCDVDGTFPNHHPDPTHIENLTDIMVAVKEHNADIGLAFDGDADRLGIVTNQGEMIFPDWQLMLFAKHILQQNPGQQIIYDVKCSRFVEDIILQNNGKPLMYKTGHSLVKAKMKEVNAVFAGEMSGHLFFNDRWYGFDDGIYAAARILEILSKENKTIAEIFSELPQSVSTPELKLPISEEYKFVFMDKFIAASDFADAKITTIDGLRVDFAKGWGLIRPSNTTPYLILRFEAETQAGLEDIKEQFRQKISALDNNLEITF